jgi:hypothetical protein
MRHARGRPGHTVCAAGTHRTDVRAGGRARVCAVRAQRTGARARRPARVAESPGRTESTGYSVQNVRVRARNTHSRGRHARYWAGGAARARPRVDRGQRTIVPRAAPPAAARRREGLYCAISSRSARNRRGVCGRRGAPVPRTTYSAASRARHSRSAPIAARGTRRRRQRPQLAVVTEWTRAAARGTRECRDRAECTRWAGRGRRRTRRTEGARLARHRRRISCAHRAPVASGAGARTARVLVHARAAASAVAPRAAQRRHGTPRWAPATSGSAQHGRRDAPCTCAAKQTGGAARLTRASTTKVPRCGACTRDRLGAVPGTAVAGPTHDARACATSAGSGCRRRRRKAWTACTTGWLHSTTHADAARTTSGRRTRGRGCDTSAGCCGSRGVPS